MVSIVHADVTLEPRSFLATGAVANAVVVAPEAVGLLVVGKEVLHLELQDALDPATREADEVGIRGVGEGLEVADVAATVTEGAISVALLPPLPNCTSSTPSHSG